MNRRLLVILAVSLLSFAALVRAASPPEDPSLRPAPTAEQMKFFETSIRPLLAEHCYRCHGVDKQKNDLRLDSAAAMLAGGKSGPVIVPGEPDQSLLIKAVSHADPDLKMPSKKPQLPAKQIAALRQWVEMGAPWPPEVKAGAAGDGGGQGAGFITDEDRKWWAFQPLRRVAPPDVSEPGWSIHPIDRFVYAKLEAAKLTPAEEADKTALVRRAYFDLIGLPPTPEEVDAFLKEDAAGADAWPKLIERLLASPRYGERWARHWLDLVRYAESDGYRADFYRPDIWRYRDYVIRSFNEDKPYDRFVREQIAGDEVAPHDTDALIATGFLRHGIYEWNQRDAETQQRLIMEDLTDITGDVFMGLSMGCAKCHNHKFDPILQADYYALQAFFQPVIWRDDLVAATPAQREAYERQLRKWQEATAEVRAAIDEIERPHREAATKGAVTMFITELQAMYNKPAAEREPYEQQIAYLIQRQVDAAVEKIDGKIKGDTREKWAELKRKLSEFDHLKPKALPPVMVATDLGDEAPPTQIPGDAQKREIAPSFLTVLGGPDPRIAPLKKSAGGGASTGRRTALANWLTRPDSPAAGLTTRVIVNRIWQYHFGQGLVPTSSDFGTLGDAPSHPDMLDWLASEFIRRGRSFKQMHRLIMTSKAYRQSALRPAPEIARMTDPDNRLLWRQNSRRLDAEQIRDAMLAVSGELDDAIGGEAVDGAKPRRSIYLKVQRNTPDPLLGVFDAPDGFFSTARRNSTTTPTQSLMMINGAWPLARAEAFARRLGAIEDEVERVETAYRLALGRLPDSTEREAALAFLRKTPGAPQSPATPVAGAPDAVIAQKLPHGGQAALVRNGSAIDQFHLPFTDALPDGDFTIEAIVQLSSIYSSASVRVIASQWSGNSKHPGWSLGVTSQQSRYQPRNLILQFVGNAGYEVVPSDLRLDLHRPYYVAAVVRIKDTSEKGVTFYVRDISDPDLPMYTANAKHIVTGKYRDKVPLGIGGRHGQPSHAWDGLIDEVRLTAAALTPAQLLINDGATQPQVVGHWKFENSPGFFRDSSGRERHLGRWPDAARDADAAAGEAALIDFCHVLFNSSEFLYVD